MGIYIIYSPRTIIRPFVSFFFFFTCSQLVLFATGVGFKVLLIHRMQAGRNEKGDNKDLIA